MEHIAELEVRVEWRMELGGGGDQGWPQLVAMWEDAGYRCGVERCHGGVASGAGG